LTKSNNEKSIVMKEYCDFFPAMIFFPPKCFTLKLFLFNKKDNNNV
jgi:hypothetical protein